MMHWFGNYGSGMSHGFGGFFMILFWVLIILLIFYFGKQIAGSSRESSTDMSAEDILKKRYAKGEISKEEFDRTMEDIKS